MNYILVFFFLFQHVIFQFYYYVFKYSIFVKTLILCIFSFCKPFYFFSPSKYNFAFFFFIIGMEITFPGKAPFLPFNFYFCDRCKFSTPKKSDLERHILIHTGERPFQCEICQKKFVRKTHLTRHVRIVHADY